MQWPWKHVCPWQPVKHTIGGDHATLKKTTTTRVMAVTDCFNKTLATTFQILKDNVSLKKSMRIINFIFTIKFLRYKPETARTKQLRTKTSIVERNMVVSKKACKMWLCPQSKQLECTNKITYRHKHFSFVKTCYLWCIFLVEVYSILE